MLIRSVQEREKEKKKNRGARLLLTREELDMSVSALSSSPGPSFWNLRPGILPLPLFVSGI